jgi:hypothetical protein
VNEEIDADLRGLKMVCEGLTMTSERMREATLEFAYDKYVLQPKRDRLHKLKEKLRKTAVEDGTDERDIIPICKSIMETKL